MPTRKYQKILKADGRERFEYFIDVCCAEQQVWGLRNTHGWCSMATNDGTVVLPFWPDAESARSYATAEWADCTPESVALDFFIHTWLPDLSEEGSLVVIFPLPGSKGTIKTSLGLQAALTEKCALCHE